MNKLFKPLFIAAFGAAVSVGVNAENNAPDYQQTRTLAEKGDAVAQFNLGKMYYTENAQEAAQWFSKAAEQGNVEAQHALGMMYREGIHVYSNNEQAFKWLSKSAEQGYSIAQEEIGDMYHDGKGVKQDDEKAKHYLQLACDNKRQGACNSLRDIKSLMENKSN